MTRSGVGEFTPGKAAAPVMIMPPAGRRPVVLLSRNEAYAVRSLAVVAPITTRIRHIPSEVSLGTEEGMPRDCAVNCDHLQTVAKRKIGSLISSLSSSKMYGVGRAIRFALDI